MISNWNISRVTPSAGIGLKMEFQPNDMLHLKNNEASSNRGFSTAGIRGIIGIVKQKCWSAMHSLLIPPESQTTTVDNNKKSLIVPDVSVDFNINTPIFEAVQGKAKLTVPNADETKVVPFEGCTLFESSTTRNPDNRCDMVDTRRKLNYMVHDVCPTGTNKNSSNQPKKSNWTTCHNSNQIKTYGKNHKEKNRHNLQINIMEDMWQITDEHYPDSDNENCNYTPSPRCSISLFASNFKSSTIDMSETSFPSISSSIPMGANYTDLPGRSSDECDSEESFVMLFDMVTPMSRIDVRSTSSVPPSVLANRQRCRQLSECSDDSIVFCYESEDHDLISQAEIDFDGEDDSEEDAETDDDSSDEDSEGTLSHQPDSGFEEKKVQFNLNPEVHVIRAWDFAYRQARKGEWEMAARDRERFRKRIQETENVLSAVFDENLRDKVYKERFSG